MKPNKLIADFLLEKIHEAINTPTPRTDEFISTLIIGTIDRNNGRIAWGTNDIETLVSHARQLEQELNEAKRDIESYRGALGYSIAGTHDGKLTDGTTPQCGMCNSEYRKSIEAERDQLRKVCDELAGTIYVHSLRPQNSLDAYNQLPHVLERKTK